MIGAARLGNDGFSEKEYLQKVDEVENLLPNFGAERIATLKAQVECPIQSSELVKTVLPFNFR